MTGVRETRTMSGVPEALSLKPRFSGVPGADAGLLNRFSGFPPAERIHAATETAEAVETHSPSTPTSLKRGANEKRFHLHHL